MDTQNIPQIQGSAMGKKETPLVSGACRIFRKILFGFVILSFIFIIVFLVYLNGKSIYANGL